MEAIKNFINGLMVLVKMLIWTLLFLYAFAGIYLLLNGNPEKGDPEYIKIHNKSWEFSFLAFFITIILVPAIFVFYVIMADQTAVDLDSLATGTLWYLGILGGSCLIGFVNYLFAD